ncbi:MAG: hypothetical protein ACK4UN_04075 [Limisphaerales bacterium]
MCKPCSRVVQAIKATKFEGGKMTSEQVHPPSSELHQRLNDWAAGHRRNWNGSYVTYAPQTVISGTNFTLNVHPSAGLF